MSLSKTKRFMILGTVSALLVVLFVMTGCSQLSNKESTINKKFSAMIPELNLRYEKLSQAITLAENIGGERDVLNDGKKHLEAYNAARTKKNVNAQLKAARELENIIGRFRANAISSPKLSASQELKLAIEDLETSVPSTNVTKPYKNAVRNFEEARTSWRLFLSAVIGGYSAPVQIEFSVRPKQ